MPRRFSNQPLGRTDRLMPETLNPLFVKLDAAVAALEEVRMEWEEQVLLFNTNALKRVSDAIQPLITQLNAAIDGGFLVAQTDDLVELVQGEEIDFFVPEGARVAFQPTPFLAITAPDERDDWAIARTVSYTDVVGLLKVEILYVNGSGDERTGWTISASSGVVEAVSSWFDDISTMRTEILSARTTVLQALVDVQAAAILIEGGPVSSIDGDTGAVTGIARTINHYTKTAMDTLLASRDTAIGLKADASAVASALALKADSSAVASSLTALDKRAVELTADFVASGSIGAGKFVALRTDGKVEEVIGSETALSLGTAVQFESNTSASILDARYNAATSKVAILYRISTAYWLIVGTVSGSSITFGSAVNFGNAGPSTGTAKLAWRSDGSKIIAIYGTSASPLMNCYVSTVSGNTPTPGSVNQFTVAGNGAPVNFITWDSVADRIVIVADTDNAVVSTVSGTTMSFGSVVDFGMSGASGWHFNETSTRLVMWDLQATQTVRAATISGTTITAGTAVTNPTLVVTGKSAAVSAAGELMIVGPLVSNGPYHVNAVTYSGTTVTFSAATKLSDIASNDANAIRVAYSASDNKFVIAQVETTARSANHEGARFRVVTISGGAPSLSAETLAPDVFGVSTFMFLEDGTAVFWASMTSKFANAYQIAGKIIGGLFVLDTKGTLQSALPSDTSAVWTTIPATAKFINCHLNTERYALVETAATYTTNAHNWIGVADAAVTNGQTAAIKLKGAVAGGQSGLTVGATQYLAPNGTISANDNGRPVGVPISATQMRLAS
jgi:hypothetical protein